MVRSILISLAFAAALVVVLLQVGIVRAQNENKSASMWSTVKEEGDPFAPKPEEDGSSDLEVHDRNLDGGFSSLDGMLQWAIGHSDSEKLKEAVIDIQQLSPEELKQRQMEIKDMMEKLKTPSDAKLMQIAIDDLDNSSLPLEDRRRALQELLILVEAIDNANDLQKLGGLVAITRELNHPDPEIRTIAAWVLGVASQNNPFVQSQILELGSLAKLIEMSHSESTEEAMKAIYTISSLIRNNLQGQGLFYLESGDLMLQNILSNSSSDVRLRRKSVFLLADLVQCQLDSKNSTEFPLFSNHLLLKSVVDLLASADLDLQEKALYAIKNLLLLKSTNARVLKEVCELDAALQRMKGELQKLISDDKFKEFAQDIENLRKEVEVILLEAI